MVALAPAATPTEQHYVAALKVEYLPLQRAFTAALRPCFFSRDMALCGKSAPTAQTKAQRVVRLLAHTTPPRRLRTADRNLERVVRTLIAAYTPLSCDGRRRQRRLRHIPCPPGRSSPCRQHRHQSDQPPRSERVPA